MQKNGKEEMYKNDLNRIKIVYFVCITIGECRISPI